MAGRKKVQKYTVPPLLAAMGLGAEMAAPQGSAARRKKAQDLKRRGLAGTAPGVASSAPAASPPKPDPVAEALKDTREQVHSVLKALVFGHEPEHVRLFCVLALQELKEHEAANLLIDKYRLAIPKVP